MDLTDVHRLTGSPAADSRLALTHFFKRSRVSRFASTAEPVRIDPPLFAASYRQVLGADLLPI